jgi:hypothetical protein
MEAIAYGQQANRFSNELQIGKVYMFNYVGFETAELPPPFGLAKPTKYYVIMHARTEILPVGSNISIPKLPSRFMDFSLAARLSNKMLTGSGNFQFTALFCANSYRAPCFSYRAPCFLIYPFRLCSICRCHRCCSACQPRKISQVIRA